MKNKDELDGNSAMRFIEIPVGWYFYDGAGELYKKINASVGISQCGEKAKVRFQGNEVMHSIHKVGYDDGMYNFLAKADALCE